MMLDEYEPQLAKAIREMNDFRYYPILSNDISQRPSPAISKTENNITDKNPGGQSVSGIFYP